MFKRVATCIAGLWCGVLIGVGLIGAPAGFAVASSDIAGRSAGRMFAIEAHTSLAVAVVLLIVLRRISARNAQPSGIDANVLLVLGSLFCTITGYFVLHPLMAAARVGEGALSFGALHGLSAAFFALKALVVLALAWRLSAS